VLTAPEAVSWYALTSRNVVAGVLAGRVSGAARWRPAARLSTLAATWSRRWPSGVVLNRCLCAATRRFDGRPTPRICRCQVVTGSL